MEPMVFDGNFLKGLGHMRDLLSQPDREDFCGVVGKWWNPEKENISNSFLSNSATSLSRRSYHVA